MCVCLCNVLCSRLSALVLARSGTSTNMTMKIAEADISLRGYDQTKRLAMACMQCTPATLEFQQ